MTRRETALAALTASLAGAMPMHAVLRYAGTPLSIPEYAALVTVHAGACEQAEPLLSPLQYEIVWGTTVTVEADTPEAGDAAAELVAERLVADPTLGGAVDWAEIAMPEAEVVAVPSADGFGQQPPVFATTIPVRLHFVASTPAG